MNDINAYFKEKTKEIATQKGWQLSYFNVEKQLYGFRNPACKMHIDIGINPLSITILHNRSYGISIFMKKKVMMNDIQNFFHDPETLGTGWYRIA